MPDLAPSKTDAQNIKLKEIIVQGLFSGYDSKLNVDHNRLSKDLFDHYLYPPQLELQKDNPLEEIIKAGPNEYLVTYDYTYAGKLPLEKWALFKATQGSQAGTSAISSLTTYTYY